VRWARNGGGKGVRMRVRHSGTRGQGDAPTDGRTDGLTDGRTDPLALSFQPATAPPRRASLGIMAALPTLLSICLCSRVVICLYDYPATAHQQGITPLPSVWYPLRVLLVAAIQQCTVLPAGPKLAHHPIRYSRSRSTVGLGLITCNHVQRE